MCGILGWISPEHTDGDRATRAALPALKALHWRGPDGRRLQAGPGWILGHTRLAIIDLTEHASQPMHDGLGGWLVFNGEIYNFQELRQELIAAGFTFRSSSDTEVLLYALRHWGPACLKRLRGMFAFGWLDTTRHELLLARDRYGVKPLAYELQKDSFRFASDLFGLRCLPAAGNAIDSESVYLYLGLGYIPAPHSIIRGIRKVRPGHYVRLKWSDCRFDLTEHQYWSISEISPADELVNGSKKAALENYERLIAEAVRYRLISDVPVGILLSGGIDSTLVTALCQEQAGKQVPTFTMGFDDPRMDEAPFARRIANSLGSEHTEFRIGEEDVLKVWDRLWTAYDEPFADSSSLPMVALCRLVSRCVKVGLSGDGGDETFCGYPWHRAINRLNSLSVIPTFLRRPLAGVTAALAPSLRYKATVFGQSDRVGQWSVLRTGLSDKTSRLLPIHDVERRAPFREYFCEWSRVLDPVKDPLDWACRMDLLTYLPDDLMVKADRASMSVGLELREPLLDHELTAWSLRLPVEHRYDRISRTSKVLSRDLLQRRVPRILVERPKQGFTPPLDCWLKGPLLGSVSDALQRLRRGDLAPLCLPPECEDWSHCASKLNDQYHQFLWRLVCFSEWMRHDPIC